MNKYVDFLVLADVEGSVDDFWDVFELAEVGLNDNRLSANFLDLLGDLLGALFTVVRDEVHNHIGTPFGKKGSNASSETPVTRQYFQLCSHGNGPTSMRRSQWQSCLSTRAH